MERISDLFRWYAIAVATVLVLFPLFVIDPWFPPSLAKFGNVSVDTLIFWAMGLAYLLGLFFLSRLAGALARDKATYVLCSIIFGPAGLAIVFAVMAITIRSRSRNSTA